MEMTTHLAGLLILSPAIDINQNIHRRFLKKFNVRLENEIQSKSERDIFLLRGKFESMPSSIESKPSG